MSIRSALSTATFRTVIRALRPHLVSGTGRLTDAPLRSPVLRVRPAARPRARWHVAGGPDGGPRLEMSWEVRR
ncbi:hypothetical protein R8Z50_18450 [Longispora sp. K20-0274]|uniref:hypothetical protein n=1 Tax=Longispora sp. K20-0274 TaxID=3088255 RepID=UPI003999FA73